HPLAQRHPLDAIQLEGAEDLVEEAQVAELLAEMVAADALLGRARCCDAGRLVPGRGDADPLVPGELVEEGEEQRRAVEGARSDMQQHAGLVAARGYGDAGDR